MDQAFAWLEAIAMETLRTLRNMNQKNSFPLEKEGRKKKQLDVKPQTQLAM